MNPENDHFAIVTGASAGLGQALAEELARRGHKLLLVSLPGTGLPEMSEVLHSQYDVAVKFIEADLMRAEAPEEIRKFVEEQQLGIDMLVNNVGIGHGGAVGDYSEAAIDESVFLNMRCTTLMTNAFIKILKESRKAFILNIGSFGGFLPVPYKSLYSATKSYIFYYSMAIREELRRDGISVSVAMPGPVLTNARVRERISKVGFLGRANVIEADKAASYIIRMMFRGRGVILPRWTVRASYIVGSLLPYRLLISMLGRLFKGVG